MKDFDVLFSWTQKNINKYYCNAVVKVAKNDLQNRFSTVDPYLFSCIGLGKLQNSIQYWNFTSVGKNTLVWTILFFFMHLYAKCIDFQANDKLSCCWLTGLATHTYKCNQLKLSVSISS